MTARRLSVALLLPAVVLVLACSGGGGGATPTSPLVLSIAQVELDSYGFVNEARSDNEVDPQLDLRQALAQIAREHSEAMRDGGFFGHRDTLGRTVAERLAGAGIAYQVVAENLALVTNSGNPAAWAHDHLMQSGEHRPNILDPRVQLIGVGVASDGSSSYWITQVFVGR